MKQLNDTRKTAPDIDICDARMIHRERVEKARDGAIERAALSRLSGLFKALGDPTRLKLVLALRDQEMCVCDLAAALELSESAVSHQLRHLREQSLVRSRREGQVVYYALDDDHVAALIEVGLTHARE